MQMRKLPTLYIATGDNSKYKSLINIIKYTGISILIRRIKISGETPKETGKTPLKNALIKARYYSKYTDENLMVSDDGLFIRGLKKSKQIGVKIKRFKKGRELTKAELFNFWWDRLNNGKTFSAVRQRSIIILDKYKRQYKINLNLEIILKRPDKKPDKITDKPLNYFMFPKGINVPISELSNNKRRDIQKVSIDNLKSILKKLT